MANNDKHNLIIALLVIILVVIFLFIIGTVFFAFTSIARIEPVVVKTVTVVEQTIKDLENTKQEIAQQITEAKANINADIATYSKYIPFIESALTLAYSDITNTNTNVKNLVDNFSTIEQGLCTCSPTLPFCKK
jgi:predicted PurR-regulated permease PerM